MPDVDGNCTPGALGQTGIAKLLLGSITGVQLPSFLAVRLRYGGCARVLPFTSIRPLCR
jgi:hypothetical protein